MNAIYELQPYTLLAAKILSWTSLTNTRFSCKGLMGNSNLQIKNNTVESILGQKMKS